MKTIKLILLFIAVPVFFAIFSCSSNDDKDIVKQTTLYVSSETGTYISVPGDEVTEGMLIREPNATQWTCVSFRFIGGFTYEKGFEYELLVNKTVMANPPQDAGNVRYELVKVISQTKTD